VFVRVSTPCLPREARGASKGPVTDTGTAKVASRGSLGVGVKVMATVLGPRVMVPVPHTRTAGLSSSVTGVVATP